MEPDNPTGFAAGYLMGRRQGIEYDENQNAGMLLESTVLWHQQLLLTVRKEALGKKRVHLN